MQTKATLAAFANVAVIGLVGFAVLRPSGPVGNYVVTWYQAVERDREATKDWPVIAKARRLDSLNAPVTLVEFSDYQCPFCRKQHAVLAKLVNSTGTGGLAFRHLPLGIHSSAEGAARTAICAEAQGRFLAMHDRLFTTDAWIADTNWMREAVAVGIPDTTAFRKCRSSKETTDRLNNDLALADKLNIHATPAFVARTRVHIGALPDTMYRTFGHGGSP